MNEVIIATRGLSKEYVLGSETVRALRGVDLEIHRNEYVAIMGPSGSGKSTLMNLIGCLDTPSGGEYILNGQGSSFQRVPACTPPSCTLTDSPWLSPEN